MQSESAASKRARSRRFRVALVLLGLGLACALCEAVARVAVALRWPDEKVRVLTHDGPEKGMYASHPRLPYVLRRSYGAIDSLGFRGPEVAREKTPGRTRIACLGASTTFGIYVPPEGAWPMRLGEELRAKGYDVETINAGVPGWVSREIVLDAEERVLPLDPDLVLYYEGRNEVFPQCFDDYRDDYLHYRDPGYRFETTNSAHKRVFRLSHLLMVLCTWHGGRFGYSEREENAPYGCIREENTPDTAHVIANLADPARGEGFRKNLTRLAEDCRRRGSMAVLCTFAFRAERLATGNLANDPAIYPALTARVQANNEIMREVARETSAALIETAALASEPSYFLDDCHFNEAGHRARAALVADALVGAGLVKK